MPLRAGENRSSAIVFPVGAGLKTRPYEHKIEEQTALVTEEVSGFAGALTCEQVPMFETIRCRNHGIERAWRQRRHGHRAPAALAPRLSAICNRRANKPGGRA